jgi:hypothetical protein
MSSARARRRGIVLAVVALGAVGAFAAPAALAQTDTELVAARKTFSEAVGDENAKRYDAALDKFRRVAAVKETANVRYRIASCLEALGRRAEALTSYEAAVKLGDGEKAAADVMRAASARAAALDRVVPRLSIVVPDTAPAGTEVRVDDVPVEKNALDGALPLDPGHHTIAAAAPGRVSYQTGVTLPEGARVSITVDLAPIPTASSAPTTSTSTSISSPTTSPTSTSMSSPGSGPPPPPQHDTARRSTPAAAYVFLGLGGMLAAGSVVSFVMRQSNLNTLNDDCKTVSSGLSCPQSKAGEVNDAQRGAQIEGPLGIGLAAGAVAATGAGIWMIATAPQKSVALAPVVTREGGMLVLAGRWAQ